LNALAVSAIVKHAEQVALLRLLMLHIPFLSTRGKLSGEFAVENATASSTTVYIMKADRHILTLTFMVNKYIS